MDRTVYVVRILAGENYPVLIIQLRKRVSIANESIIRRIKIPKAFLDIAGAILLLNGAITLQLNS